MERWDIDHSKHSSDWISQNFGAFIDGVHDFDEKLFGISNSEASYMDPQQRILLECVYKVLAQHDVDFSSCSVAVGVSYNEYFLNLLNLDSNGLTATSGTLSVLSGRVSYTFDLRGPSKSVDTACSSSLVCVHLSITSSIANGSNDALACGVNLMLRHETSWVLAGARMLSTDGRCKTLDSRADGYGRAEGCIVHYLTHKKASFGSHSFSVTVSGTAIGQDGRSSSLTAPNGPAQQKVIRGALRTASKLPKSIHIVEMHGTGTALGDPIEIGALSTVFEENALLRLQAVKSSSLHSEPAAGAMGMINGIQGMVCSITNSVFASLVHLNPYVERVLNAMNGKDIYVPRVRGPFIGSTKDSKKSLGVSSFAFQGTNTHAIIDTIFQGSSSRNPDGNLRLHCKSHWWTIVNVPVFKKFQARTVSTTISFIGKVTSSDGWILDMDAANESRIPAAMITSLGLSICHQMTSLQISISRLSLFWDRASIHDSLSLNMDFHSSRMDVEVLKHSRNWKSTACSGSLSQSERGRGTIRSVCLDKSLILLNITQRFRLEQPICFCVKYNHRGIVGQRGMRSHIVSEATMQAFLKEHRKRRGLAIEHFYIPHEQSIFSGQYLGSGIKLSNRCSTTSGVRLEGVLGGVDIDSGLEERSLIETNKTPEITLREQSEVLEIVRGVFQDIVGYSEESMYFGDIGIDSISSLELRRSLETTFNTQFPATLIFDYPDIKSLASYVYNHIGGLRHQEMTTRNVSYLSDSKSAAILAISGMCGNSSRDLELNMIIEENKDRCCVIPPNRWDLSSYLTYVPYFQSIILGCWADDIEKFDNDIARINEQESVWLDPQVKVLLDAVYEAALPKFADRLNASLWGTYIGCVWTEFPAYLKTTTSTRDITHLTGSGLNFSSGRVSFSLDLKGPCIGIDTACSSSLVALHMAQDSLESGAIDYGLSGGTNLMLLPSTSINLATLGSLSLSGRCKTLDAQADGYGRGEGSVAMVTGISPDENSTIAFLKGSSCNQDGRSSSLTAPNGPSQAMLVNTTLQRGIVTDREVSYINLHGTGTALGDPIEVGALTNIFKSSGTAHQLVSVKASIGHTEGSAGLHGVSGAIVCLSKSHNLSFHSLRNVNPYINQMLNGFRASFVSARQTSGVPVVENASSTVSSYGMSGTNACCVLQKAEELSARFREKIIHRKIFWPCVLATNFTALSKAWERPALSIHCLLGPDTSYLADHMVAGRSIMPGAGMLWISFSLMSKCLSCPDACLTAATITSPIEIRQKADILVLTIDVLAGNIGIERSFRSKIAQNSTKILNMTEERTRRYKSLHFQQHVTRSGSLADIRLTRQERYPAVLDCSIHLAPATSFVFGSKNEPRAVVGVEMFTLSDSRTRVVSPLIQRNDKENAIFTHHWGLADSKNSSLHHRIFNLEAKEMKMVSNKTSDEVMRYAVLHQAERGIESRRVQASQNTVALAIYGAEKDIMLKYRQAREGYGRSVAWLTEVMQGKMTNNRSPQTVEITGMSNTAGRFQMDLGTYGYEIRLMKSFMNVAKNEFGNLKSRVVTFSKTSGMSFRQEEIIEGKDEISLQDRVTNTPILVRGNSTGTRASGFGEFFVTGGMGALGTLILDWVVTESANEGSFLGRSGRASSTLENSPIQSKASASSISFVKADSSREEELTNAMLYSKALPGIIMHAGGVLDSKMVKNISLKSIQNVYAAKVSILDTFAKHMMKMPMKACQLFSSLAAFDGIRGQSIYASANSILDVYADESFSVGVPMISVQWGNWGGKGMAADDHTFIEIMQQMGLGMIHPSTGLGYVESLLFEVMSSNHFLRFSTLMVNLFLWDKIKDAIKGDVPSILRDMIQKKKAIPVNTPVTLYKHKILSKPVGADGILDNLMGIVKSLGLDLGLGDDLMSGGLDSLSLNSFVDSINDLFGTSITPTDIFNFSSLQQIGVFISSQFVDNVIAGSSSIPNAPRLEEVMNGITDILFDKIGVRLGSDEPLLASGLDSLSITDLSSMISDRFGVSFKETDIVDHPNIRDIAEYIISVQALDNRIAHMPLTDIVQGYGAENECLSLCSVSYIYPCDSSNDINRMNFATESKYDNVRSIPLNRWDKDASMDINKASGMWMFSFSAVLYQFI